MKNVKLLLDFDGRAYSGWQSQENSKSIENEIKKAVKKVFNQDVKVIGASRTDKGVSARGFVCNFHIESSCPCERMIYPLNDVLPEDIRVIASEEADCNFHSRFSAKGKYYRYTIEHRKFARATNRNYAYNFPYKLDVDKMNEAKEYMTGEMDFKAFMNLGSPVNHTVRTVDSIDIIEDGEFIYIDVKGRGFLYNMVRIMAGTLIYVGTGLLSMEDMKNSIEKGLREGLGPTLKAEGLTLMEVYY